MRFLSLAVAAGLTLALGACGPEPQPPMPTPSPTTTPFFASDEEALAAAEEVYREYLAMSDLISSEGGARPERIAPYVTEDEFEIAKEAFDTLASSGLSIQGQSAFDSMNVAQLVDGQLQAYLCLDVQAVRVVDSSGMDRTPTDRQDRLPLLVTFHLTHGRILIGGSEAWTSPNYCS